MNTLSVEQIFAFLSLIRPLSPACMEYLRSVIQFRRVAKNEEVLKIGEINRHLYFIKKGGLYCYYFVGERKVVDWFYWENELVVSLESFYYQLVSPQCIVAMEPSELYYITFEQYEYACETFLEFHYVARWLHVKYMLDFARHSRLLTDYKGKERYKLVLEKYPMMVQRAPLALLATWLKMTPPTLSRFRGELR